MDRRRQIRELAMQVLYQVDLTGACDRETLLQNLADCEEPAPEASVRESGVDLALAAWHRRGEADAHIAELAPDWPTHRQPPVDRAILRLACCEMVSGHAPVSVAINEAVELAKRFCGEASPAFINGVLDKLARRIELPDQPGPRGEASDPDAWLRDAKRDEP